MRILYRVMSVLLALLLFTGLALAGFDSAKKAHDRYEFDQAFPVFKRLAEKGDKRAQYYVGRMNHLGEGRGQDLQEAVKWYRKSADQGFARAQNNLGVICYMSGDIEDAIFWYRKAAAQRLPQAESNLKYALEDIKKAKGKVVPERPPGLQNMNDPAFELRFNRLREGMK